MTLNAGTDVQRTQKGADETVLPAQRHIKLGRYGFLA